MDELEPLVGRFDWDEAFRQNPQMPVFEISEDERRRLYGVRIARPRRKMSTGQLQKLL